MHNKTVYKVFHILLGTKVGSIHNILVECNLQELWPYQTTILSDGHFVLGCRLILKHGPSSESAIAKMSVGSNNCTAWSQLQNHLFSIGRSHWQTDQHSLIQLRSLFGRLISILKFPIYGPSSKNGLANSGCRFGDSLAYSNI